MKNPIESSGGESGHDALLAIRGEELREVLNTSAGAEIDSLVARLDIALDSLTGRTLEAELDDIESELMETPDLGSYDSDTNAGAGI